MAPLAGDQPFAALTFIVAPALLTNASSVLLLGTTNRLARSVDRTRELADRLEGYIEAERSPADWELDQLQAAERRVLFIVRAMMAFYVAVGAFAASTMVALIGSSAIDPAWTAAVRLIYHATLAVAVVGIGGLVTGTALLVWESRLTFRVLRSEAKAIRERTHHLPSP